MSKVKLHPTNNERVLIELTAMETSKLFRLMGQYDSLVSILDPAMLSLRDKLDLILDHVTTKEELELD